MSAAALRLASWLNALRGYRALAVCFACGGLLTLGYAPVDFWPIGFISLPVFLSLLNRAESWKIAALRGFMFGYGHSIAGTYWIANALLVDADKFAWLYPISVLGLSAAMALWFALLGFLYYRTRTPSSLVSALRFAVLWVGVEYLRSIGIFGFPWNLLGSMALAVPPIAQVISLIGTYGASLLLILVFLSPYMWFSAAPRRAYGCYAITLLLIALFAFGLPRLQRPVVQTPSHVRIVQGNIPQSLKWTREGIQASHRIYRDLTNLPTQDGQPITPKTIIWPETTITVPPHPNNSEYGDVGIPNAGILLTGALRVVRDGGEITVWNSIVGMLQESDIGQGIETFYDKHQLVPFGEFVPLRSVLPLDKITPGNIDFSRGKPARTIALMNDPYVDDPIRPFRPLICYEVIFPWLAATAADDVRPAWLVNVTNDAWYGDSPGPYQHLAAARLRAIEQGLPLVRAANTGISAVIDPYGRIVQSLPLGTRGIIDAALPEALPATLYARFGERITLLLLAALWLLSRALRPR